MFYSMPNLNLLASKRNQSSIPTSPVSSNDLLPSELLALSSNPSATASPHKSHISLPSSTSINSTSTPIKKSRNDLFELDWSPVTPNVNSSFTPPPAPAVQPPPPYNQKSVNDGSKNWLEQSRSQPAIQIILPPTPPNSSAPLIRSKSNEITGSGGIEIPTTPTSPFSNFNFSNGGGSSSTSPLSFSNMSIDNQVPYVARSNSILLEEVECLAGNSTNPVLDSRQSPRLRLAPTTEYTLGEGRHASVYLASYVPIASTSNLNVPATTASSTSSHGLPQSNWKLCAAKRVLPDRESQVAGLGEAFILSRLAVNTSANSTSTSDLSNKNIIGLYGVKDERDGIEPVPSNSNSSNFPSNSTSNSYSNSPLLLSRKPSNHSTSSKSNSKRITTFNTRDVLPPLVGSPSVDGTPTLTFPDLLSNNSSESTISISSSEPAPASSIPKEIKRREKGPRYSEPFSVSIKSNLSRSNSKKEDFAPTAIGVGVGGGGGGGGGMTRRASGSQFQYQPSQRQQASSPPLPSPPFPISGQPSSFLHSQLSHSTPSNNNQNTSPPPPRIILLLEYCPFGTVLSFLKSWPERVGRKRWLIWARELVGAVAWSHEKGVLHADLKPQNVLIAQDLSLRLSDFGLATFISPTSPPLDPLGLGTPAYSPPEFVHPPPSPFSFPSDIFSLGVTLSVMISGHEAYEGLRTVERMFLVGRGGYYEWEERRRLGSIGIENDGGSSSVSRTNSIKSSAGGGRTLRSRPSAGGLAVGELGAVTNVLNGVAMNLSGSGVGRMRSDSLESCRSFFSTATGGRGGGDRDSGDWSTRSSWVTAVLAQRLLKMDRNDEESTGASDELLEVEGVEIPSPETLLSFLPPPSPIDSQYHQDYFTIEGAEEDDQKSGGFTRRTNSYPLGTPYQYFLNGIDVVPLEIRELLRAMTSPRAVDRPTALQALRVLESLEF